jgi:polyphosphate kinase
MTDAKNDEPEADGKLKRKEWYVVHSDNKRRARLNALTHILSKIPYEELPSAKVELPKRQHRGDYKEIDYPFRVIPEVF